MSFPSEKLGGLHTRAISVLVGAALFFGAANLAFACPANAGACSISPSAKPFHVPVPSVFTPKKKLGNRYAAGASTISHLADGQSHIIRHFPVAMGMNGYVVQIGDSRDVLIYTSKSGRHFFIGGLFTAQGVNLSKKYAKEYLPAAQLAASSPSPSAASVYKAIQKTTWFALGSHKAPKILWVGFDPNCIFCHETFDRLLPYIRKGEVQLRIMPVGFLKPSSLPKAVTILESKHPAKAWTYDEAHFNVATEEGGIRPLAHLSPEVSAEVRANWAWMNRNGYYGTPLLVWQNTDGKAVVQDGMPMSMKTVISDIGSSS